MSMGRVRLCGHGYERETDTETETEKTRDGNYYNILY